METIYKYTEEQAEADGFLFDVRTLAKAGAWNKGLFNYVTTNLLFSCGYFKEGEGIKLNNIVDLLNQSLEIVKKKSNNLKDFDYFFSGKIELPNGNKQEIFIQQNSTGKFTIMLPEDY